MQRLVQVTTFGSDQRQSQKKPSQTIQLTREMASQFRDMLEQAFDLD